MLRFVACGAVFALGCATESNVPDGTNAPWTASRCADGPPNLEDLDEVPVTRYYEGPVQPGPDAPNPAVVHTSTQREWTVVESMWAGDVSGRPFGSLDTDAENTGHGVLLAAQRSSTCGMSVVDVRAYNVGDGPENDDRYTTHVELRLRDSSGSCEDRCDMDQWMGVAIGVPIAHFPFSGEVTGCVHIEDACDGT